MKKFIYVVVTVLILSLSLSVVSFAATSVTVEDNKIFKSEHAPVITFSDDFKTLYYNGHTYYQKDLSMFESYIVTDYYPDADYYEDYDDVISTDDYDVIYFADYKLTEEQEKYVSSVDVSGDDIIVFLTVRYKDGTSLSLELLRDDYLDDYEKLTAEKFNKYEIDFEYPYENVVNVDRKFLFENEKELINVESYRYDYLCFNVYIHTDDGTLSYYPGLLYILDDEFYYFSFEENNVEPDYDYSYYGIDLENFSEVYVHKITNEDIITQLKEAEQTYYEDDFGIFENDELANSISYFFLTLIFGVVPGIVFVVSLVFAIIKKKTYRKLLFAVCGFTLAEIITFIIFMIVASIK